MLSGVLSGTLVLMTCSVCSVLFLFGLDKKHKEEKVISWTVPVPPDLIPRLRGYSPVAISRMAGMTLDDVFDFLRGDRQRTCPEMIDKMYSVLKKLEQDDERLEREALKLSITFRGLDAIEEREKQKMQKVLRDDEKAQSKTSLKRYDPKGGGR